MSKIFFLSPRMSEKAYGLSEERQVYVFDVPRNSSRLEVAKAVASQFNVTVTDVNITNVRGKTKRTISAKGRRVAKGRNNHVKKAYVTLKKGDKLAIFAAVEEEEAKAEKMQVAAEKAIEKQEKKAEKEAAKPARRGFRLPGRRTGVRGNK